MAAAVRRRRHRCSLSLSLSLALHTFPFSICWSAGETAGCERTRTATLRFHEGARLKNMSATCARLVTRHSKVLVCRRHGGHFISHLLQMSVLDVCFTLQRRKNATAETTRSWKEGRKHGFRKQFPSVMDGASDDHVFSLNHRQMA